MAGACVQRRVCWEIRVGGDQFLPESIYFLSKIGSKISVETKNGARDATVLNLEKKENCSNMHMFSFQIIKLS